MASDKIWVPLNPLDSDRDLASKMSAARPSIVVADEDCLGRIDPGQASVTSVALSPAAA